MAAAIAPIATFRTGFAASRSAFCLSASIDAFPVNEPYSRAIIYNENAPHLWTYSAHECLVPSVCTWLDPLQPNQLSYFAVLGEDGQVAVLSPQLAREEIADSGLRRPASAGYGYLAALKQIGSGLYACGTSGQVYRREGVNDWRHVDEGLLQPLITSRRFLATSIDGPHERALYVVGSESVRGWIMTLPLIDAKTIRTPPKTPAAPSADQAAIQAAALKVQHLLYDTLRALAGDLANNPDLVKVLALGLAAFQLGEKRFDLSDLAATPAKVSEKMAILMRESERRTGQITRSQTRAASSFTE